MTTELGGLAQRQLIKNSDSEKAIRLVDKTILNNGLQDKTITNDCFHNYNFSDFLNSEGICNCVISPSHTLSNGLVEQMNSTLNSALKKLCPPCGQDQCDLHIDDSLFGYPAAHLNSPKSLPFERFYGKEVMLSSDQNFRAINSPMSLEKSQISLRNHSIATKGFLEFNNKELTSSMNMHDSCPRTLRSFITINLSRLDPLY